MRFLLVFLTACALTSKAPPLETRYFSPEEPAGRADPVAWPGEPPRVRLGRFTPSSHLRKRIVHRTSPVEVGLYETRWWTEDPDHYVRRALERALFVERGVDQAVAGQAITLDVDVVAFEEVLAPRHTGRVQLRYRLRDAQTVVDAGVVTVERPVAGAGFDAVVAAIGAALDGAVGQVADRVVGQLTGSAPGAAEMMPGRGGL